jgi:hypothetical protein
LFCGFALFRFVLSCFAEQSKLIIHPIYFYDSLQNEVKVHRKEHVVVTSTHGHDRWHESINRQ